MKLVWELVVNKRIVTVKPTSNIKTLMLEHGRNLTRVCQLRRNARQWMDKGCRVEGGGKRTVKNQG